MVDRFAVTPSDLSQKTMTSAEAVMAVVPPGKGTTVNMPESIAAFGALSFLAAHCPVHQKYSVATLRRLFFPAAKHSCVRFFQNEDGVPCAALIWARLSGDVVKRMIYEHQPPKPEEWNSGGNLWFLDLLAPFDHGAEIARYIARNPPDCPFHFARVGDDGKIRKVVRGDAASGKRGLVQANLIHRQVA
jgi:cytolysin-activating lysine-acyltransferase